MDDLQALADVLDVNVALADHRRAAADAHNLHMAYALASTQFVLDLIRNWIESAGKKLLVLLSYGRQRAMDVLDGGRRFDQSLIDYLQHHDVAYVDALQCHRDDFEAYRISAQAYLDRFYIGHYNPNGNHFFAFAVKDAVVDWIDPKPVTYQPGGRALTQAVARLA